MTFLQPWVLLALPLVALPLIIHLINQRRFQTVQWAAMMFLLSAQALSRGYSRLRHWLIMALRMAAVAAVIVAVGRPLSRGWLALAGGGRPDTAIVILDRSPSMQARDPAAVDTKLDTGRRLLAESLATLRPARCVVLTDPDSPPLELDRPGALEDLPTAGPTAAPADIPRLVQAAYDFIRDNATGVTEIWICSDQRANDWAAAGPAEAAADDAAAGASGGSGWAGLRESFARLPQPVRFQLVSFAEPPAENVSIRVTSARLDRRRDDRVVVLSLTARREADQTSDRGAGPRTLPVTIEIGGAASTVELPLAGAEGSLADHLIPLASDTLAGWGRVSIPADGNAADNEFFFTFAAPPPRRSLVVAEDAGVGRGLALVAGIPPDKLQESVVETLEPTQLSAGLLDTAAALLWQGPLPGAHSRGDSGADSKGDSGGTAAPLIQAFVARGGQVVFFPPATPGPGAFAGVGWTAWTDHPEPLAPATWRTDQDVLANTISGAALPVGELEIRRSCGMAGDVVPLASLPGGTPLVARALVVDGAAAGSPHSSPLSSPIFCATTPLASDSSLASEGVVLYALVQRSIDRGLAVLGAARQVDAPADMLVAAPQGPAWTRITGPADATAARPELTAGVFAAGDRLVAVNRPPAEDEAATLADARVDELFSGLTFARVAGRAGRGDSLVQEIWRAFLIAMVLALIGEGLLSLPARAAALAARRPAGFPLPTEAAA
jgi:hypothetical protein